MDSGSVPGSDGTGGAPASGAAGAAAAAVAVGGGPGADGATAEACVDAAGSDVWADDAGWRALLQRERTLFDPWADGTAIGIVPRAVADAGGGGTMMVWERRGGAMHVGHRRFDGFASAGVAVLFVAAPGALEAVHARLPAQALGAMKLALRAGTMLLYVLVPRTRLIDDGCEDFLEALGLAYMGACR